MKSLTLVGVALIIGYLVLTPMIFLLYETFFEEGGFTLGGFERAYGTSGFGEMIRNSIVFTIGSSILPLVIGTFLAYVTVRTNVPFRSLLFAAALVPLIIPGLLYTIAWVLISGSNAGIINQVSEAIIGRPVFNIFSMAGMIWVEGTHNTPLAFLFMAAAFRSMDPSLEEAALVAGASRAAMIRKVTIPLIRPAMAGAMLLVGIKTLGAFEVPTLLGLPDGIYVFVSRIFFELRDFPYDTAAAGALSIGLIALAVVGVFAINRLGGDGREYATVTGKGFRPRRLELGKARGIIGGIVVFYFVLTTVLPISVMLFTSFLPFTQGFSLEAFGSFSLDNYRALLTDEVFGRSVANSGLLSIGSATIIMALTGLAAWFVVKSRVPGRQLLDHLTFLPIVVPGLVIGLAVSFVYLRNPFPFQIYGTLAILLIAYVTNFMPYGMRYAVPSLLQLSNELEESASVAGATWTQVGRRVVLPLMWPGLLAGWIYLVIVTVRELSSSILLYSPGNEVISIVVFQLYELGAMTTISALGIVMVTALILFVAVSYRLGARVGLGDALD
jgi:iron(III) transport system permease protein